MTWLNEAEVETKEQRQLKLEIACKSVRKRELQKLLDSTDHKILPDYEMKKSDNLKSIKADRSSWRKEIREIQQWMRDNELPQ